MRLPNIKDITADKTTMLENLTIQVREQGTVTAVAEARYNALQEKLGTFNTLLLQARANESTAQSNQTQYLKVEGDVRAVQKASITSSEVSQSTYNLSKKMLRQWEAVAKIALEAATRIAEATEYIQKRKAANSLINKDLVSYAVEANKNAAAAVKIIIAALTNAMDALTSASEASQSTDLAQLYAEVNTNYAIGQAQPGIDNPVSQPMEPIFKTALYNAKQEVQSYYTGVETITGQSAAAKKEYSEAAEQLSALQAALEAAETAVAG
jgi:hypothetical protein